MGKTAPPPDGPYDGSVAAIAAMKAIYDAGPVHSIVQINYLVLVDACETAGIDVGVFDQQVLYWLANWQPEHVASIAGLIRRAHLAGLRNLPPTREDDQS